MPKRNSIAAKLRLIADALENANELTQFKALILGLQDCVSLTLLAAFQVQKRMIANAAHDVDSTETTKGETYL